MKRILLTGMSGTGKSTVTRVLAAQGGMCRWTAHGQRLLSRALSPRLCVSFLCVVNDMSDPGS